MSTQQKLSLSFIILNESMCYCYSPHNQILSLLLKHVFVPAHACPRSHIKWGYSSSMYLRATISLSIEVLLCKALGSSLVCLL